MFRVTDTEGAGSTATCDDEVFVQFTGAFQECKTKAMKWARANGGTDVEVMA
tara:strand:- start:894 stop:1049 length:156 start_codon:yes stop_codon:yes gene_type:complete